MQKLPCILLIDDDPVTNFLHEQLLLSLGVADHCLVAENGAAALTLLAEMGDRSPPTLVLLDVHMPVMNGIEFLEAYAHPVGPQPIIVILTTSGHVRDRSCRAMPLIADWVSKPLTKEKLNALLQRHFGRHLPPTLLLTDD